MKNIFWESSWSHEHNDLIFLRELSYFFDFLWLSWSFILKNVFQNFPYVWGLMITMITHVLEYHKNLIVLCKRIMNSVIEKQISQNSGMSNEQHDHSWWQIQQKNFLELHNCVAGLSTALIVHGDHLSYIEVFMDIT